MARRHVLLIDDEADIREVASMSLEAIGGWRVSSADCGEDGIAKAIAEEPDVILCDVMMPGIDGPATFKRLQEHPVTQGIPVILLTARVQRADRLRFAQLGVTGVLPKPFDPMALSDQVDALVPQTAGPSENR
jgi:CheY-like chemotaxis protein